MYPELIKFATPEFLRSLLPDQLIIHSYGFMIAVGMITVYFFCIPRVKKYKVDKDQLSNLFSLTFFAAFVGGKLFYYLEDLGKYIEEPSLMFHNMGSGFVFFGSLIFAVPFIIYWLKKRSIPIRGFLDILAFVGPMVHGFGRIGCLLAGCCYGKVCDSAIGISFTNELAKARPLNTPLYPTQLFDIVINILILLTLFYFDKRKKFEGQLFLIYIIMYAIGRSIVEIYRGDEARGFIFGQFSHSQLIAVLLVIGSLIIWKYWSSKPQSA